MNRNLVSGLAIGVFAGFLIGYFVGASRGDDAPPPIPAPQAAAPAMPAAKDPTAILGHIAATRQALAADPKDVKAWIALGNDYFDTQQARQAVDAYARALALAPGNPDVLTDQGVMYRQLKDYPKAIADFNRAHRLAPQHLQCLFNLGIVYSEDLKQPGEARKAWEALLAIAPAGSPQADQARAALAQMAPAKP